MSRRQVNPSRRLGDGGGSLFPGSSHSKHKSSPIVSIVVFVVFSGKKKKKRIWDFCFYSGFLFFIFNPFLGFLVL